MQREHDFDIRLNSFGEPDVDYYIAKAHKLRSQAIGTGFSAFKVWLLNYLDRVWFPDQAHSHAPRRVVQSDWPWVDLILQSHPSQKAPQI
jgi:hypothetical protein